VVWPLMTHGWQTEVDEIPEASEAMSRIAAFIGRVLDGRVVGGTALSGLPAAAGRPPRTGPAGCAHACSAADQPRRWTSASHHDAAGATPQSGRTFSACGPFCPCVVSYSTFWFSFSDR